jgi:uncharacterized protein YeaO (DUF488 family)
MITEIDFAHLKEKLVEDPDAKFYLVMRQPPEYVRLAQIQECPVLAPSDKLVEDFKLGYITEDEFKRKYFNELKNPIAIELMKLIVNEGKEKDVYLVSEIEDHRFLLLGVLDCLRSY